MNPTFYKTNKVSQIFYALPHKSNSLQENMSLYPLIILIPGQSVFALTPKCWMLWRETPNLMLNVFGLTTGDPTDDLLQLRWAHLTLRNQEGQMSYHSFYSIVLHFIIGLAQYAWFPRTLMKFNQNLKQKKTK